MTDDLNTLFPQPVVVEIGGERIEITPILTRELAPMIAACRPIMAELANGDVLAALADHPESLIRAVAIGARMSEERIGELPLDELITLAAAVLEVNADFFSRRMIPAINAAIERVTVAMSAAASAGSSSTPVSAPQASAG